MNATSQSVLAIAAHPDDIEFVMSGTMMQLAAKGWKLHYFNVANGCCGSMTLDRVACAAVRLAEAQKSASIMNATFYPPICDDLSIFYAPDLLAKVAAVIRHAQPSIVLTHSLIDYMEDHQNTARLAQTAAFSRSMPSYFTDPQVNTYDGEVTVYHAQPHGNRNPLSEVVKPTHHVDVSSLMQRKGKLLLAHASQAKWLDATQQLNSYIATMEQLNREVGQFSGQFAFAEGWRRHLHFGFCSEGSDPLRDALGASVLIR